MSRFFIDWLIDVLIHSLITVVRVDGVRLCLWTAATKGPIVHPPGDIWVWRATVEWYWQGKTEEKPAPVPLRTLHGLSRARTRASAVRGRRLTAWTISFILCFFVEDLSKLFLTKRRIVGWLLNDGLESMWKQSFQNAHVHISAKLSPVNLDHEILYVDRSWKDEQLLKNSFSVK
jgi:hypothetical protein